MAPRYTLKAQRPTMHFDDERIFLPGLIVDCVEPTDTGLEGPNGEHIYRNPEPIGFLDELED